MLVSSLFVCKEYLVLQDEDGGFVYADADEGGKIISTHEHVGKKGPKSTGKKKGLKPEKKTCFKRLCGGEPILPDEKEKGKKKKPKDDDDRRLEGSLHGRRAAKTTGRLKNLVVPLYFKDHARDRRRVPSVNDLDVLMNADEPDELLCPTGSLKKVYRDMSYGQLEVRKINKLGNLFVMNQSHKSLQIESTVAPWYVTKETEKWYADGASG